MSSRVRLTIESPGAVTRWAECNLNEQLTDILIFLDLSLRMGFLEYSERNYKSDY